MFTKKSKLKSHIEERITELNSRVNTFAEMIGRGCLTDKVAIGAAELVVRDNARISAYEEMLEFIEKL